MDSFCPNHDSLTFGDIIKCLREEKRLTLRELSIALNIEISMLGKIEKNNRKPTELLFLKVSNFFNVNMDELKIAHLSDLIVCELKRQPNLSSRVLKVTTEKVKNLELTNTNETH